MKPTGTVGSLPPVVRAGATLTLLVALAAIALVLLPVSATVRGEDDNPAGGREVACGSVLAPSADDASADDGAVATACSSARVQRAGWSGTVLAGSIVVLVFALLVGDGMSAGGRDAESRGARSSPDPDAAE